MPRNPAPLLAALALLAGPDLLAQETPIRIGLQASLARPGQDLRLITLRSGAGGGLFFERDEPGGWSLRTRFDFLQFKEDAARYQTLITSFVDARAYRVGANSVSLGVEARHAFPGTPRAFLLGGVAGTRVEFDTVEPAPSGSGVVWTKEKTSMKLGFAGGIGWRLSEAWAVTVRYATTNLGDFAVGTLEAGVECRFQ